MTHKLESYIAQGVMLYLKVLCDGACACTMVNRITYSLTQREVKFHVLLMHYGACGS